MGEREALEDTLRYRLDNVVIKVEECFIVIEVPESNSCLIYVVHKGGLFFPDVVVGTIRHIIITIIIVDILKHEREEACTSHIQA